MVSRTVFHCDRGKRTIRSILKQPTLSFYAMRQTILLKGVESSTDKRWTINHLCEMTVKTKWKRK
uniref:Uncharacterized protein n=1 Tax=Anguilla anguilla TaxID=7936 RepID=A0A0E9PER9_ANGAN